VRRQSGAFEVMTFKAMTIDANAPSLPGKVLFYVKIHIQLCGFFAILRESSKRLCGLLAIIREICIWLNGYFTSSAAAVLVICCHR